MSSNTRGIGSYRRTSEIVYLTVLLFYQLFALFSPDVFVPRRECFRWIAREMSMYNIDAPSSYQSLFYLPILYSDMVIRDSVLLSHMILQMWQSPANNYGQYAVDQYE